MCSPYMVNTYKGSESIYNVMKLTVLGMLESSKSFSNTYVIVLMSTGCMCKTKELYGFMFSILYGS